jgi:hypothetical protein
MIRQIAHHITRRYLNRRASDAANNMTGSDSPFTEVYWGRAMPGN